MHTANDVFEVQSKAVALKATRLKLQREVWDQEAEIRSTEQELSVVVLEAALDQQLLPKEGWVERLCIHHGDSRISIRGTVDLSDDLVNLLPHVSVGAGDQAWFHIGTPDLYLEWFGPSKNFGPGRMRIWGDTCLVCEAIRRAGLQVEPLRRPRIKG